MQDAKAALGRWSSLSKYTIASKPVLVSFIHTGVFVPTLNPPSEFRDYTFAAATNPSLRLQYWDEDAYVSELVVSVGPDLPQDQSQAPKDGLFKEGSREIKEEKSRIRCWGQYEKANGISFANVDKQVQ